MEPLLLLVHRVPYPPNKGDKIRSYHLLRFLARHYRVHLGTFVDDPSDAAHIETLKRWCADVFAVAVRRSTTRLASLRGLLTGEALTLPYYRDAALSNWVQSTIEQVGIRKAVLFSSPMAQYVMNTPGVHVVADFCDVDSAKWTQYAADRPWPLSWLYRREGARLAAFERIAAARAGAVVFVTPAEAQLFAEGAPEVAARVHAVGNGVDADYFDPDVEHISPYNFNETPIVFTGAMDYWPNVDAVTWFAHEVLPRVRSAVPDACFYVVGMNPTPAVLALREREGVVVTGRVDDVRPYVQHARVVVAPLRIARGVQNKVLEAMAMARPVVVTAACATGIGAVVGREFEAAADATSFAQRVLDLMDPMTGDEVGRRARRRIQSDYHWEANLRRFGALLEAAPAAEPGPRVDSPAPSLHPAVRRAVGAHEFSVDPDRPPVVDSRPLIAHVMYRFDTGGLENGVVNLLNRLPRERYRHAVIALTTVTDFRDRVLRDDVSYYALHKAPGPGIKLAPKLARLFRQLKPAIVHTRNLAALEAQLPAWWAGVPARVHGEHGWDIGDLNGANRRNRLTRRLYRPFVSHAIALSQHLVDYLDRHVGLRGDAVSHICNGVDTRHFAPSTEADPAPEGWPFARSGVNTPWIVGTVGRLAPVKDQVTLARAFVEALARDPSARASMRLVIVGDGALAEPVREVLRAGNALDLAWLPGERDDVALLMRHFDVFVLPSLAEGISNTLLEAMATGLPAIATDVGGNRELVQAGETGRLVPPADVAAMATALLDDWRAPEQARAAGARAREVAVARFSIDRMVSDYVAVYERLLARGAMLRAMTSVRPPTLYAPLPQSLPSPEPTDTKR